MGSEMCIRDRSYIHEARLLPWKKPSLVNVRHLTTADLIFRAVHAADIPGAKTYSCLAAETMFVYAADSGGRIHKLVLPK